MKPFSRNRSFLLVLSGALAAACSSQNSQTLVTIPVARTHKARVIDIGQPGDSPGDLIVFDQPLLDQQNNNIGANSGVCVRTRIGHSLQCQWTLSMQNGSIQVAGREFDRGASDIAIVGGTGAYAHITGHMTSLNNEDGTYTQTLYYRMPGH